MVEPPVAPGGSFFKNKRVETIYLGHRETEQGVESMSVFQDDDRTYHVVLILKDKENQTHVTDITVDDDLALSHMLYWEEQNNER